MSFILHPIIQYDYLYNETFLLSLHDALPIYYAGRFFCCNPARIRCGVNGASRRRTPVASKIALAMAAPTGALDGSPPPRADRKSTRLNSSHGYMSYDIFCLKTKARAEAIPSA